MCLCLMQRMLIKENVQMDLKVSYSVYRILRQGLKTDGSNSLFYIPLFNLFLFKQSFYYGQFDMHWCTALSFICDFNMSLHTVPQS
jgi:hypothetical protein